MHFFFNTSIFLISERDGRIETSSFYIHTCIYKCEEEFCKIQWMYRLKNCLLKQRKSQEVEFLVLLIGSIAATATMKMCLVRFDKTDHSRPAV